MRKIVYILFLTVFTAYGQSNSTNNCPCSNSSETSEWTPRFDRSYDVNADFDNFTNSINGMYVAEDRDSLYQIKIIVDKKSYGTFVHFQHLSFSKARLSDKKKVILCKEMPNIQDGGWIGQNIFTPEKAINKQVIPSTFFAGESYLRLDKQHFYRLYKCDKQSEFGIHDADRQRFYRKTLWKPKGDFIDISLFGFIQKDVKKYNKQELAEMRNAVYARYNYAFKEDGKWYAHFNKKPDYRWNYFKDVTPFITTLEKENIKYIAGFESADYYNDQFKNDFLDFWQKFRIAVQENDSDKLFPFIQFPFIVNGEHDGMPALKISKQRFAKIWPMLLQQENYDISGTNKLVSWLSKSVFSKTDAFAELMINTRSNNIANLGFQKINGIWKMSNAYADTDLYPKIQDMLK